MKITTIILTAISLFLVSCEQGKKKQEEIVNTELVVKTTESNTISNDNKKAILYFIEQVRSGKETLSKNVHYPLKRFYSIPSINNRQEFLKRYEEVFDKALQEKILQSDPSKDWKTMGSQGIMLHKGDVWIDYDGTLIAINDVSAVEEEIYLAYISEWQKEEERLREAEEVENTYCGYELGDGALWYKVIYDKNNLTSNDSVYTSNIHPGEKLPIGKVYSDNFEFFDYNDEGDDLHINVLKDGKIYTFVANELSDIIISNPLFKQGDLLKIQWEIDFLTPAGDNTIYFVVKFAKEISKTN